MGRFYGGLFSIRAGWGFSPAGFNASYAPPIYYSSPFYSPPPTYYSYPSYSSPPIYYPHSAGYNPYLALNRPNIQPPLTQPPGSDLRQPNPPPAELSPDVQKQVMDSTIYIERTGGGSASEYHGGLHSGTGVVVAGGGLILTAEHVVLGAGHDAQGKDFPLPADWNKEPPTIKIYDRDRNLIGDAEIVARGGKTEIFEAAKAKGDYQQAQMSDLAVLHITHFASQDMEKKYSKLGVPLAKTQSDTPLVFRLPGGDGAKPGNSGGSTVNPQGELVGLNDAGDVGLPGGTGRTIITPISNPNVLHALGADKNGVQVADLSGRDPTPIVMFGYRRDKSNGTLIHDSYHGYVYPYSMSDRGERYVPPAGFVSASANIPYTGGYYNPAMTTPTAYSMPPHMYSSNYYVRQAPSASFSPDMTAAAPLSPLAVADGGVRGTSSYFGSLTRPVAPTSIYTARSFSAPAIFGG